MELDVFTGVPAGWQVIAVVSVLLGGFMKGISGMGLPLVATPVLAAILDLPSAIAMTIPAGVLCDLPVLWNARREWREARRLTPLLLPAVLGIVIGTQVLVGVDPARLRLLLGVLVLLFVAVSHFRLVPRLSERTARRLGPVLGLTAGTLQGAAGQSGPVVSIFFFQLELARTAFLFVTNTFFLVVDTTQFLSLLAHGLYTPVRVTQAVGVTCVSIPALLVALRVQRSISELLFRRIVLIVLACTGAMLIVRTMVER